VTEKLDTGKTWELARAILRYLERHPEAKDSLDGIARWWIQREWCERQLADVERALDVLLSGDLVLETRRPGIPPYYHLNPERRDAIARILRASSPAGTPDEP